MTAPSNANTSGLEVVAWEYRYPDTEPWHKTMSKREVDEEQEDLSEVRPYAVTAASAQERISELEAIISKTCDLSVEQTDKLLAMHERATAAEARADRLAKALERIGKMSERPHEPGEPYQAARAALQQETQP